MGALAGVLVLARAQAELRMTETVTAGLYELVADVGTLGTVRLLVESFYTGPAQVKYPSMAVSEQSAQGQQFVAQDIVVKVPVSAVLIPEGAEFVVLTSSVDAHLVGRVFRVKGSPQSGQVSSHRYPVEE